MTSPALAQDPRTLRATLDQTNAEINLLFERIRHHYAAIDRLGERIRQLEERAATIGEELMRRRR